MTFYKLKTLPFFILIVTALFFFNCSNSKKNADDSIHQIQNKPNVLFIAVDDLRPLLGCFDVSFAQTPNIDNLASEGRLFKNHYVQVATCGASRASMLRSRLPRTKQELYNEEAFDSIPRNISDKARSLPELFKNNGYETVCIGKISHSDDGYLIKNRDRDSIDFELPNAWSKVLTPLGKWKKSLVVAYPNGKDRDDGSGYIPYKVVAHVNDNELPDGMFAEIAIKQLANYSKSNQPFFMGLGFLKPHLPFVAPKQYFDLYTDVNIPSTNNMQRGDTKKANKSAEFYKYVTDRPFDRPEENETLSENNAQDIRRAYMACVSYTDTQIGKVLKALKEFGLTKNTIVVLWGDHGWHLGENNVWGKHTPLEKGLHSPLIIKLPEQHSPGVSTEALASSIDIYPTLVDACNLENIKTYLPLEGNSLVPVLQNPNTSTRNNVLSFWRGASTIVDKQYRLIVSGRRNSDELDYELYDHRTDPGELKNIANDNPKTVTQLMSKLKNEYPSVLVK